MGSDTASQDTGRARQDFNPRSPDGERPGGLTAKVRHIYFNPRSPDGERRAPPRRHSRTGGYFNPRSPDGERPSARSAGR